MEACTGQRSARWREKRLSKLHQRDRTFRKLTGICLNTETNQGACQLGVNAGIDGRSSIDNASQVEACRHQGRIADKRETERSSIGSDVQADEGISCSDGANICGSSDLSSQGETGGVGCRADVSCCSATVMVSNEFGWVTMTARFRRLTR